MKRVLLIIGGICLLVVAAIAGVRGISAPEIEETETTLLTYTLTSDLSHRALKPEEKQSAPYRYYTSIIDSITVIYGYHLDTPQPDTPVHGNIKITAAVANTGIWEKEITLLPGKSFDNTADISFPLDLKPCLELAKSINEELGLNAEYPEITLRACVDTIANTKSGTVSDTFIHECLLSIVPPAIEWYPPFDQNSRFYRNGQVYEHRGCFGYRIKLLPNTLYGATTMEPEEPEETIYEDIGSGAIFNAGTVEYLDITVTSLLAADETLENTCYEVEVLGIMPDINGEEISFEFIPKQAISGDCDITFPIDIALLYDIIDESDDSAGTFNSLMLTGTIHATADSTSGSIDEIQTIDATLTLTPQQVLWNQSTDNEDNTAIITEGAITEVEESYNTDKRTLTFLGLGLLGIAVSLLLFAVFDYYQAKSLNRKKTATEQRNERLRNKHKDVVIEVEELPVESGKANIVPVASLEELIKIADSLFRPVLHLNGNAAHRYCILDSGTRYEYRLETTPPSESDANTSEQ